MPKKSGKPPSIGTRLAILLKELDKASDAQSINPLWDAEKILQPVKAEYAVSLLSIDPQDRIYEAIQYLALKQFVDGVEGRVKKVAVRGIVLFWVYYRANLHKHGMQPSVEDAVNYCLEEIRGVHPRERAFPNLENFLVDIVGKFLKNRKPEGIASRKNLATLEQCSQTLYKAFQDIAPKSQDRCINRARDVIAGIIQNEIPGVFREGTLFPSCDEPVAPEAGVPSAQKQIESAGQKSVESTEQKPSEPEADYFDDYLGSSSADLPDAYLRHYTIDFFIDRTVIVEDILGVIERVPISQLPEKILGKKGMFVGESGIGITSAFRKILNLSKSQWREWDKLPVIVKADELRPNANVQKQLFDVLLQNIQKALGKDAAQAITLRDFIKTRDDKCCVTFLVDNADRLDTPALQNLLLDFSGKHSVFFAVRPWQAEKVRQAFPDQELIKIYFPPWASSESEELADRLFGSFAGGHCDRRVFELWLREFPELKQGPLEIMACFEQSLKNDDVLPIIMQKWVTEMLVRNGLPDPGILSEPEANDTGRYLWAVGQAMLLAINEIGKAGMSPGGCDLTKVRINERIINNLSRKSDERIKRRLFTPIDDREEISCTNEGLFIYLGGLVWAHRKQDLSEQLSEIYKKDKTSLGRIRRLEESIWEYQQRGYITRSTQN